MTCHAPSTTAAPIVPRRKRRSRSRLLRSRLYSESGEPTSAARMAPSASSAEIRSVVIAAEFMASQRLKAEIEHVLERTQLRAEFAAPDHRGSNEVPPLLRLSLREARRRIHALFRKAYDFLVLSAPLRDDRNHCSGILGIGLVRIEDRAHE